MPISLAVFHGGVFLWVRPGVDSPRFGDTAMRTLMERLEGKVRVDFETARRLFTLISVLHWKG